MDEYLGARGSGGAWHGISRRWLAPRGGGKQPVACIVPEEEPWFVMLRDVLLHIIYV